MMVNSQLGGIAVAIGLLRHGGFEDAAHWLQALMTNPADDSTLEILRTVVKEVEQLNEIPAPQVPN